MITYARLVLGHPSTRILIALSLFSITLSFLRKAIGGESHFFFLLWNLFLSWIPWFIGTLFYFGKIKGRLLSSILFIIWFVFFPNAPYLLTDLIHLEISSSIPNWFDLLLLLSYAFTGLIYGFVSLRFLENSFFTPLKNKTNQEKKFSSRIYDIIPLILIYIACFGIYLGRFLRWNSWDLITNTSEVIQDGLLRVLYPFDFKATWAFTLILGTILCLVYRSFTSFNFERDY